MASFENFTHGMSEQKRICGLMNSYYLRHGHKLCAQESDTITDMSEKVDIIVTNVKGEVVEKFDIKSTKSNDRITYTFMDKNNKTSLVYNGVYNVKVAFVFDGSSVLYIADPERLNKLIHNEKCVKRSLTVVGNRIGSSVTHSNIVVKNSNVDAWDYYNCEEVNGKVYATYRGQKVECKEINMSGVPTIAFENGSEYVQLTRDFLTTHVCGGNGKVIDLNA